MKNSSINLILSLLDNNFWLISRESDGLKKNKLKGQQDKENHIYKECGNKIKENSQEKELKNSTVNNHHLITEKESIQKQIRMALCSQRKIKIFSQPKKIHTVNIVKLLRTLLQKPQLNLVSVWIWIDTPTWILSNKKLKLDQEKWTKIIIRPYSILLVCQLLEVDQTWWNICSWKKPEDNLQTLDESLKKKTQSFICFRNRSFVKRFQSISWGM